MTTATLRKHGHSIALTLPPSVLQALSADVGTQVDLRVEDGRLIVEPRRRPKYQLADLLRGCDELPSAEGWDELPPVGSEAL